MPIPYAQAQSAPTYQKALLDIDVRDYPMGTVIYTSGQDTPHAGWRCVFPDGTWRVVENDAIRLCW